MQTQIVPVAVYPATANTLMIRSLTPGQSLTNIPANVVAICNVAWTPEVISAYQAALDAALNKP